MIESVGEVIIVALVAYRVWRLIGRDDVTDRIRPSWAMLNCSWCLGTWVTIAVGLATFYFDLTMTSPWLLIPAAAALVGFLGQFDKS